MFPDNTCVSACAFILLSVDSVDDFMEEMSDTWTDADSMEVCRVKIRHITFVTPADRRRGTGWTTHRLVRNAPAHRGRCAALTARPLRCAAAGTGAAMMLLKGAMMLAAAMGVAASVRPRCVNFPLPAPFPGRRGC